MTLLTSKTRTIPLGIVLARRRGVTRWVKYAWSAIAVVPGAGRADWKLMRDEEGVQEYHACTLPLDLHRADVEAYKVSLSMDPPSVFVVLRPSVDLDSPHDLFVQGVTASAYEAQDYLDSGEEQVEPVPMPEGLVALVRDFVDAHFRDEPFIKRQRDRQRVDLSEDGIGDARIRQTADVYRAPGAAKPKGRVQ
ncbi:MAG: DUF3305 domain-containing protein [Rhodobacter sp.]|nr:DUF3305 domain-containing protein [Rhodobacter sp.]